MDAIEFGARQAVVTCVKVKSGEIVVVITDRETEKLAEALQRQINAVGAAVQKFIMEDLGPRPADGKSPLPFPKEVEEAMSKAQASFFMASSQPGEFHSFRVPMTRAAEKYLLRHAHMVGFVEEMMSQGMAADYGQVQALSRRVHAAVSKAKEIKVTSPAGTDLTAVFSPELRWDICDGDIQPGRWSNLPDGEVFTTPIDVNGRVVIDGCLGDIFVKKYGNLKDTPLSYDLRGGRCARGSVRCNNDELRREFEKYTFETDENSDRVGEFAIGTNTAVTELIGNMLQDEKIPGVHLALGDPIGTKTGAQWKSKAHNDGLLRRPTVVADGRTIMKDGKFTI